MQESVSHLVDLKDTGEEILPACSWRYRLARDAALPGATELMNSATGESSQQGVINLQRSFQKGYSLLFLLSFSVSHNAFYWSNPSERQRCKGAQSSTNIGSQDPERLPGNGAGFADRKRIASKM